MISIVSFFRFFFYLFFRLLDKFGDLLDIIFIVKKQLRAESAVNI